MGVQLECGLNEDELAIFAWFSEIGVEDLPFVPDDDLAIGQLVTNRTCELVDLSRLFGFFHKPLQHSLLLGQF